MLRRELLLASPSGGERIGEVKADLSVKDLCPGDSTPAPPRDTSRRDASDVARGNDLERLGAASFRSVGPRGIAGMSRRGREPPS